MTEVPNYRLNPQFAVWDDAAFEWLTEYESSPVDPTEDSIDVITPVFIPDEEESTFSTIFVEEDEEFGSTTVENEETSDEELDSFNRSVIDLIETLEPDSTTTESATEDYDDDSTDDIQEVIKNLEEDDILEEGEVLAPSLGCGMLFRGLSFVTFMVVPFVILI